MGKDLRAAVHQYFKEFGFDVGEAIYGELQKPGGLPRLLKKLGLPSEGDSNTHYATLVQYFRMRGTRDFLQLVGVEKLDFRITPVSGTIQTSSDTGNKQRALSGDRNDLSQVVPLLHRGESSRPKTEDRSSRTSVLQFIPSLNKSSLPAEVAEEVAPSTPMAVAPPAVVPPAVAREVGPYTNVDKNGFPKGPLIPAPSPNPALVKPGVLAWDPSKPNDPLGVWPEVERRSGRERRRMEDRRLSLEITYKNRRFGKDRRKTQTERRKDWPKDGFRS